MKSLFLILTIGIFLSCKKEVIYPTDELPANVPTLSSANEVSSWGKFLVIDAKLYVENKETGAKTVYQHFGVNKSRSSLRWGNSLFDIETIIKDTTTYSFWKPISVSGTGKFVLNGDTTKHYLVQYNGSYRSIIEDPNANEMLLGGSARPFSGQTIDYTNQIIAIEIQEMEGSINGNNCRYWTQLKLKKIQSW